MLSGKAYARTTEDGKFEYTISDNQITIEKYLSEQANVDIPNTIEGYPVVSIRDNAFKEKGEFISTINIPINLRIPINSTMDKFRDCKNLTSIYVDPSNSQYISIEGVMYNKDKTVLVKYPANKQQVGNTYEIESTVERIRSEAFDSCRNIETIILSGRLTTIDNHAFYNCAKLKNITLKENLKSIGKMAFNKCDMLEHIEIPSSVSEIEDGAFSNCGNLQRIIVNPDNKNYSSLENRILCNKKQDTIICYPANSQEVSFRIPENIKHIQERAFEGTRMLGIIYIPKNVVDITAKAFMNSNIVSVTFEHGIAEIDMTVFWGCTGLRNITIPRSVHKILGVVESQQVTIHGWKDSYANTYAVENNVSFQELEDNIPPSIEISPNGGVISSDKIVRIVSRDNESLLDEQNNVYEYQLSNSNITVPTGQWKSYNESADIKLAEGLDSGNFYCWIKTVQDKNGNKSNETIPGYFISNVFTIDNTKPTVVVITDKQTYRVGETAIITATFSKEIEDNTPKIKILPALGSIHTMNKSTDRIYTFNYTIPRNIETQQTIEITNARDIAGNTIEPNRTKTFNITEERALESIEITTPPNKITYVEGENFDKTGMKITATYNDSSTNEVINYTITDGNNLTKEKNNVNISYTENGITKTTTQAITVTQNLNIIFDGYKEINKNGNKYISNVNSNTTLKQLKDKISTNGTISIYKGNEQITNNEEKLATGMKLEITLNNEIYDCKIVVKGDSNGDAKADLKDMLLINKHRLNKALLKDEYLLAGDVNEDNKADLRDLLQINKFRLGKISML